MPEKEEEGERGEEEERLDADGFNDVSRSSSTTLIALYGMHIRGGGGIVAESYGGTVKEPSVENCSDMKK